MQLICESAVLTAVAPAGPRDRLLTFLTRGRGALRLYARRLSRRVPATVFLEPLQGGELRYGHAREGAPGKLHAFVPQRVWPGVRADLARTLHAQAFLELVNLSLTEGESQPEVFTLLVNLLDRLETARRPGLARAVATVRLHVISGFSPSLEACVGCRAPVPTGTGVLLSPDAGGVLCRACLGTRREATIPVSPMAHAFLLRALRLPPGQANRLAAAPVVEREILRLLDRFFEARTGVQPRAGPAVERLESLLSAVS